MARHSTARMARHSSLKLILAYVMCVQFTQLDMEMAFMDSKAIMQLAESLIVSVLQQVSPLEIRTHDSIACWSMLASRQVHARHVSTCNAGSCIIMPNSQAV